MTPDESRALDEAAARAMGWTVRDALVTNWTLFEPNGRANKINRLDEADAWRLLPFQHSSGDGLLSMLAWCVGQGLDPILRYVGGEWRALTYAAGPIRSAQGFGASPGEALAKALAAMGAGERE